jgi:hypothetical protein
MAVLVCLIGEASMLALLLSCTTTPELPPEEPPAAPEPVQTPPELVVTNDTHAPVTLDRSFGPASPLRIAAEGEVLPAGAALDDVDDAQTGGWIKTCLCDCRAAAECPECEPPQQVEVTLAPGESYTVPWGGELRAYLGDDGCLTRLSPPAGRYVLTACDVEGRCARAGLTLPTTEPAVIRLSQTASAKTCADLSEHALLRAGRQTREVVGRVLRDRPVGACPEEPVCVEPEEEAAFLEAARQETCTSLVIPRGERIDAVIFLPLPEGWLGGARFVHFYDPDATRQLGARYEQ